VRTDHRLPINLAQPTDWIKIFDPTDWTVFVRTASQAEPGTPVSLDLAVAGWSVSLLGSVVGSRGEEGDEGLVVAVSSSEREKINYLNGFVRGGLLNHREKRRLPVALTVTFGDIDGAATTTTKDVSDDGVFLNSKRPLPPTSQLHMLITIPGRNQPWSVMGKVSHIIGPHDDLPPGMGISLELNDVQRTEWMSILLELETRLAQGSLPSE
jgi:PilZ domain